MTHIFNCCSSTLLKLLCSISSKLNNTLPAANVANIVTPCVAAKPASFQILPGVAYWSMTKASLKLFMVLVAPHLMMKLCFKSSAAHARAKDMTKFGIFDSSSGLIQVEADNF